MDTTLHSMGSAAMTPEAMVIFGLNAVITLMLAGGLGGLLFGYRKGGLVFPHWDCAERRSLNLGFLADCVWGAAGALVVFIIIPLDLKSQFNGDVAAELTHHIKLLAVAFIGGYGGPALMDLALSRTFEDLARRTDEVEKQAEQVAQQADAMQTTMTQREEQDKRDLRAFEVVDLQLGDTMQPVPAGDVIEAIQGASPAALDNIYQRAKEARHHAWLQRQSGEETHHITERTIPIFQGLLASHYGRQRHRYHAQLGYALKDKEEPDWAAAKDAMESARTLLEESGRPMSPYYDFNWAVCAIEQEQRGAGDDASAPELRSAVAQALRRASDFWKLKPAVQSCPRIQGWLERNRLSLEGIAMMSVPRRVAG